MRGFLSFLHLCYIPFVGFLALVMGIDCWRNSPRPVRGLVGCAATFLAGMGTALAPVVVYFVANDAWSHFVDCVWTHNLRYAQRMPAADGLRMLGWTLIGRQMGSLLMIWILAALGLSAWGSGGRSAELFGAVSITTG